MTRTLRDRIDLSAAPRLAEFAIPFALVLYLSLESGGYGTVTRSEVGVIVWWLVLIGAAVGVIPHVRLGRASWLALGLLAAFAGWTALAHLWTESSGQTTIEVARVLTYLGVLALALSSRRPGAIGRIAAGVGAAIALVAVLALLSRLQPSWFPENTAADFLPITAERLSFPLGYWNGLAALLAMGVPLVLTAAAFARHAVTAALAAAALPAIALAAFYTLSRGGAVEVVVALVVLFVLAPRRLTLLPSLAIAAGAGGLLVLFATSRDALEEGLLTESAGAQGDEMLVLALIVCAAAGLLQLAVRRLLPEDGLVPGRTLRRAAAAIAAAAVVGGLVVGVAAGAPGELADAWEEFKTPNAEEQGATRFGSASGSGRYQNWSAALDANASEPLTGIGPGTYGFWWTRSTDLPDLFVRDAHSLYLETLGETGIVGLAILLAFLAVVAWAAVAASRREGPCGGWIAGASASCAAYLTAAAIDWVWELAAISVAFMLLAGALLAAREQAGDGVGAAAGEPRGEPSPRDRPAAASRTAGARVALGVGAVVALVAISIPLAAYSAIDASERSVAAGDLDDALDRAQAAARLQPYAATPSVQEAIVLELLGEADAAAERAREATRQESTNWQTWLVLSRLEAKRDNPDEALRAYRRARSLNPQSPLFGG